MTSTSSEFPVPSHTVISRYHLNKMEAALKEQAAKIENLSHSLNNAIAQRNEARMWAYRLKHGWETNDELLPAWIFERGWGDNVQMGDETGSVASAVDNP